MHGRDLSVGGCRALFLDRDGVINVDHGYVGRIADMAFLPGIFALVRAARARGFVPVVATNQSGIARGYYDLAAFGELTRWMMGRFAAEGAPLAAVYYCPWHPEGRGAFAGESPWRKPAPGMLLAAAADLGLDLGRSVMIGDAERDIEAAAAAGIPATWRLAPAGTATIATQCIADLAQALALLATL